MFQTIIQALQTTWKAGEIEEKAKRLRAIGDELTLHILVDIYEKVDMHQLRTEALLQSVEKTTREIMYLMIEHRNVTTKQTLEVVERFLRTLEEKIEKMEEHRTRSSTSPILTTQLTTEKSIIDFIKTRPDFSRRMDRYDGVKEAQKETFQWIFEDHQHDPKEWDSFSEWMCSNSNLYWISGKAGSGKSTLVKFLVQHPQFRKSLETWADGEHLIIAEHFFWNAGSNMQNSQDGLFRTLLLAILQEQPALACVLFPDRFQHGVDWSDFPTVPQLVRAFNKLIAQTEIPARIVLVIDGLDEFETTSLRYTALADIFIEATKSPNFKAVLSSRPLSAFELLFKRFPKLRLHDLTRKDIQIYVHDRLAQHERIARLSLQDSLCAANIISDIVSGSSGVFLWVRIVIESLLEGFQNYDSLEDLYTRLKAIPEDIEVLFDQMFHQIPTQYKLQSSRIFQLVRFCDDFCITNTPLVLYFSENSLENVLAHPIQPLSWSERETIRDEVRGRLRSRCAGLIELSSNIDSNGNWSRPDVQYLHRTVADWIHGKSVWDRIIAETKDQSFDPGVMVSQSLLMMIKTNGTYPPPNCGFHSLSQADTAKTILLVMRDSIVQKTHAQIMLLNECDRVMKYHFDVAYKDEPPDTKFPQKHSNWYELLRIGREYGVEKAHNTFLSITITHSLDFYLEEMIRANDGVLPEKMGMPLLHYVRFPRVSTLGVYKLLLEHGADPNERFRGESPWQIFLLDLCLDRTVTLYRITILRLFLRHGVDIGALVDPHKDKDWIDRPDGPIKRQKQAKMTVRDILQYFVTDDDPNCLTDEMRIEVQNLIQELDKGIASIGESRCGVPVAQLIAEPVDNIDFTVKTTEGAAYESQKARKNGPGCHGRLRRRFGKIFKRDV